MKYIRDRNNDVGMQDQSNHKLLLTLEWKMLYTLIIGV